MDGNSFFENSIDAMLVIQNGEFMECNDAAVAMLGYDRKEEILHRHPSIFSPEFQPDGRVSEEKAEEMIQQAMEQGYLRFEWIHQRKDGADLPVEVSLVAIPQDGEVVLHTIWRDVTERHQMEKALRESEERYRTLVENQSDLLVKVDLEGRFLYVSPSYCELFGKTEEELQGHTYMPLIHEDDRVATEEAVARLFHPPYKAYMEQRAMTGDGWRWLAWHDSAILNENGEVVEIIGIGRDITERKQTEKTLKESEERFRSIFNASNDALFIQDLETGEILDVNRKMCELYGVSREEALNYDVRTFSSNVPPYTLNEAMEWNRRAAAGEPQLFEWMAKDRGGHLFWVEVNMRRALIGSEDRLIVSVRDISDRKRMEEALFRSEERFRGMFENMGSGVAIYEALEDGADFLFLDFNPAGERIENVAREDVVGRRLKEAFSWSVEVGLSAVFRRVWRTGNAEQFLFCIREEGQVSGWRNNHVYRLPSGEVIAVFDDLTAQKKAEWALQKSEEKYRLLATNSLDMIWMADLDLKLTYVNAATQNLLGYSPEEYLKLGPLECIVPESWEKAISTADELYAESKIGENRQKVTELQYIHSNGTLVDVEVISNLLFDSEGQLIGYQGRSIDITKRKRMEVALLRSEERFRGMFENMGSGVAIFEAVDEGADFIFMDFNPAAERIEHVSREEVVGKRLTEAFPVSTEVGIFEVFRRVWRTGEAERYPVCICEDGEMAGWRDNHIYRLPSGEVVAVYDDLTAQKEAEWALQESEEKYRLLATNTLDVIWTSDLNHRLVFVNDAVENLLGYTPAELQDMEVAEYCLPDFLERIPAVAAELIEESERGEFSQKKIEMQVFHKSGNPVDVELTINLLFDSEGTIIGFQGRSVDITERKRIEEERERFVTAIDQAAETIVITDSEGLIEYVNPAFERITGYAREEALGLNPNVLKSGEHDEAFYRTMWETILGGETWHGVFVNQKKDGSTYTEEATISPVKDALGKIVNFVAIKMDITNELAREEQYRQTQKMESVGRLASGVAHDFNNILQTITGFCGLILSEMDPASPHWTDVQEIQTAVKHAGDLTRQLLAFSRKRSSDYQTVDLNTVLSEGGKMLRQALGEGHQLQFQQDSTLYSVRADAIQILQIAMNLIVNARDAMPEGGEIVLATENVEFLENQPVHMPNARKGLFVCLSVTDAGCGMDERQLGYVFDPFYTTKQPGEGTGLGLSVVYGIVKEHGGWIHVESEPGNGSVFKIYLPEHDGAVPDASALNGEVGGNGLSGKKILLLEDEPMVRELTREILHNVGYTIYTAETVEEAKEVFASENGAFDLLFSDVMLPDGNGLELAESLLEQQPGLRVLLFSGYSDERAQVEAIRENGFGYMRKPFNLKTLLDLVSLTIDVRK